MLVTPSVQDLNKTFHTTLDLKAATKKSINTTVYKFYYFKSDTYWYIFYASHNSKVHLKRATCLVFHGGSRENTWLAARLYQDKLSQMIVKVFGIITDRNT